jgi:lipopolysaccharide export system protein LptA
MSKLFVLFFLLFISSKMFALESDSKARIFIVADTTSYNYKLGTSLFEGHVTVDQGTTHLIADKLITHNNEQHKIQEVIAYGNNEPAHYWTTPKAGDKPVHATAGIIKFYPLDSNVTLEQNVIIKQGDNSFKGQLIHYNRDQETIIVPATKRGRAVLVYHPEN